MILSEDSLALLLIGSHLALNAQPAGGLAPLVLREWNGLARMLQALNLQPGDLLGLTADDICSRLGIRAEEAARLVTLLGRRESLREALEQLASHDIFSLTRMDTAYPERYRQRLKDAAPLVLFYTGDAALLGQPGIAVVGSRHLDATGEACAALVGNACGVSGQVLYSGGAKGVDTISMAASLAARGTAAGILADSLEKAVRRPEYRAAIERGDLCLATPYNPDAGFSVGAAMGRNRLIYALADYAVVVASDAETGGTWAGATEALKAKWAPVFVAEHSTMPEGNKRLLDKGALPFPYPFPEQPRKLKDWLEAHAREKKIEPFQPGLF